MATYKKYIKLLLGPYVAEIVAYDEHAYTELDQRPIEYAYTLKGPNGAILSSRKLISSAYFSELGETLERELNLSHSNTWPSVASTLSENLNEKLFDRTTPLVVFRKAVELPKEERQISSLGPRYTKTLSSQEVWEKQQNEERARRKMEEDARYEAFVAENAKKLQELSPFSVTYAGDFSRRERKGILISKRVDGQNVYYLKTATKEIPMLGMTKQIQHALGMRFDLPKSPSNPYGYTEKSQKATNVSAMERGTRIHGYIEQGIKSGLFVADFRESKKLMQIMETFRGRSGSTAKLNKELETYHGDIDTEFKELLQAQEVLELIKREYPAGDGWKIKSEYKVSDYKYFQSSVDILAVNERKKEAVVLDLKTGSKTPVGYVRAQTSSYATLLSRTDVDLKGFDISIGKIDFSGGELHTPQVTNLKRLADKEVDKILYTTKNSTVGYYGDPETKGVFSYYVEPEVLPFAKENIDSLFKRKTKKVPNEGNVVFFDLETLPMRNGVSSIRSVSIFNMSQYRNKKGLLQLYHSGKKDALFERAYLSRETFNSTSDLTLDQSIALSENLLTDAAVINFERIRQGKSHPDVHIATSKDVLEIMKQMAGKTVVGHNIIDYDFGVLFYTGSYEAKLEGGEEGRSRFIDQFNEYMKSMTIIDTLDLAKILQKGRESVLKDISNSGLIQYFSPDVYRQLKDMLHQSSADIMVTAKNFETLMNIMSPTERDILYNLIKDKHSLKHSYTVTAATERWTGDSEQKDDVRFALRHSSKDILNRPPVITASQWSYIKAKIKRMTEYEKQQLSELLKEGNAISGTHDVYLSRKGNALFFITEADASANRKAKDKDIIELTKATIGALLRLKKKDADVDFDYRQAFDSIILSKLGDTSMGLDIIDKDFASKEDTKLLGKTYNNFATFFNRMMKEHYRDEQSWDLLNKMLGGLSGKDAKYLYKHIADLRKLYSTPDSDGKLIPDAQIDQIVMFGLMDKLNISDESFMSDLLSKTHLRYFSPNLEETRLLDNSKLTTYLKGLTNEQRIALRDKLDFVDARFNLYSDLAKAKGKDFGAAIKQYDTLGLALFNKSTGTHGVENVLKSTFDTLLREPPAPVYATELQKQEAFLSSLTSLPNFEPNLLQKWVKAKGKYGWGGYTDEEIESTKSLLNGSVSSLFKYGYKIGLRGNYAEDFQNKVLTDALENNASDIMNGTNLADWMLGQQRVDEYTEAEKKKAREKEIERERAIAAFNTKAKAELPMFKEAWETAKKIQTDYNSRVFSYDPTKPTFRYGATNASDEFLYDLRARREAGFWSGVSVKNANEAAISKRLEENSLRKQSAQKFIDTNITMPGDADRLLKATKSQQKYADTLELVADRTFKLNRVLGATVGVLSHIPFYNPDQLFSAGYHQISSIRKSLNGVVPGFLNTSVTKMLMGGMQDYELGWQKWKYGIKSAMPAFSLVGSVMGAMAGAPFGAGVQGAMLGGQAMTGLGAWATQIVGNRYERAIQETGLFFSSRFNKMGALLAPAIAALSLFTKALKIASVPLLAGLGMGIYHYKRALANMSEIDTPLYNLTGISYGRGYNELSRGDYLFGMRRGATNSIIESIEFAKQGLFTLGKYDKNKLVSAAMLGILNTGFMNPGTNGVDNYKEMMDTLWAKFKNTSNKGRFMYLLNEFNPEMAKQFQTRTDMDAFFSTARGDRYANRKMYYNDLTYDQSNEFKAIRGIQASFAESIKNSLMKIAAGIYNWKGFDFMNKYVGIVGSAANAFADDKPDLALKIIGAGIRDFFKGLEDTWAEAKDFFKLKGLKEIILNEGAKVWNLLKIEFVKFADFMLTTIEPVLPKITDGIKSLFLLFYEQFKKLFDFVGSIRLNIDLNKLAQGDLGGLKFSVGYQAPDVKEFSRADMIDYGKGIYTFGQPNEAAEFFWKSYGINPLYFYKNPTGLAKYNILETNPRYATESYKDFTYLMAAMERNNIPMTEQGMRTFLANAQGGLFNNLDLDRIRKIAWKTQIAPASDVLDKVFLPTAEEVFGIAKNALGIKNGTLDFSAAHERLYKIELDLKENGKLLETYTFTDEEIPGIPRAPVKSFMTYDWKKSQ